MTDTVDRPPHVRTGTFALAWLGRDDESARKTVARMCDRGELACVRVGERQDRLIPLSELDRLEALAQANRRI